LGKAIAKVLLVVVVACMAIAAMQGEIFSLDKLPINAAMAKASWVIGLTAILMSLTMIVIAAIDIPVQIHQHTKKLKMTLQQVKDEMKETEGRPEVKGRIRQLQRQFAESRMMADIETADVVITNPTHYSVALRYAQDGGGAPILVAKGVDLIAFKIREIADNHDVQIVEVPVLSRALFYTTEIGDEIPEQLYLSVAQVLAYVYQLNNPQGGKANLGEVEVPDELVFDTNGRHVETED
jgi:flagellar biosynthetic protein FlhB